MPFQTTTTTAAVYFRITESSFPIFFFLSKENISNFTFSQAIGDMFYILNTKKTTYWQKSLHYDSDGLSVTPSMTSY